MIFSARAVREGRPVRVAEVGGVVAAARAERRRRAAMWAGFRPVILRSTSIMVVECLFAWRFLNFTGKLLWRDGCSFVAGVVFVITLLERPLDGVVSNKQEDSIYPKKKQEDDGEAKTGEKERLLYLSAKARRISIYIAGGVVGINPTFNFANGQNAFCILHFFLYKCI